jgi:ParB family chromosome partitioning protein
VSYHTSANTTKRRPVVNIDPARIISRDRVRKFRPDVVDALAGSISKQGLLQPIIVQRRGADFVLIAGRHRLQAVRKLGQDSIRAEIAEGLDADQALLIEIDENLVRAELSPAERALHISKRKELYEAAHPKTKHGGDRRSVGSSSQIENLKAFVANTATKTGKGRSTVARDVTRANKVGVLDEIIGTSLDKGSEIDALAKLPEDEQRKLAGRAKAGEAVTARYDAHETPPESAEVSFEQRQAEHAKLDSTPEEKDKAEYAEWLTAEEDAQKASAQALAEFTVACRTWLPKVTEQFHQDKARRLVVKMTERAGATELGAKLTTRPNGNGEAPAAIPGDLSIPPCLQRGT